MLMGFALLDSLGSSSEGNSSACKRHDGFHKIFADAVVHLMA
jgi:hypothetical protein